MRPSSSSGEVPRENFYRPTTKLREGTVFKGVCHSVYRGEGIFWSNVPSRGRVSRG